eukprot:TRINITY_DN15861_c0_g1_i1.p1 TRINITY_DN15861_c0_g1~~TRINITY_DN15861_c0_g1_i1.p1  ORF type:complete len:350 (+),score=89.42 TRINITY_DN15861_c0_g1_i1:39-1052(+)
MRRLKAVIYFVLTAAAIVATVLLVVDWVSKGRKDSTRIEVGEKEALAPPHLFFNSMYMGNCGILDYQCHIVINDVKYDCRDAIGDVAINTTTCEMLGLNAGCDRRSFCLQPTEYVANKKACDKFFSEAWLHFNASKLAERGQYLRSTLDYLAIILFPAEGACQDEAEFKASAQAVQVLNAFDVPHDLHDFDVRVLGVPVPVGVGSFSFFNFKLYEREYKNGTVSTRTDVQASQYSRRVAPDNKSMTVLDMRAASFSVVRNIDVGGISAVDLLGSVFGWWGVLTGACLVTIFDTGEALVKRVRSHHDRCTTTPTDPPEPSNRFFLLQEIEASPQAHTI